jgi:CheY-like chemotaxis protein
MTSPVEAPRRVLVVDDEEAIRDFFGTVLENAGFDVVTASDGPSGLHSIQNHAPDLVLLDLMIPGLDGLSILERMAHRPETAGIPVLVVSAYSGGSSRVRLESNPNVRNILSKPIRTHDLVAEVRRVLDQSGLSFSS